jgi:hypothetical protein
MAGKAAPVIHQRSNPAGNRRRGDDVRSNRRMARGHIRVLRGESEQRRPGRRHPRQQAAAAAAAAAAPAVAPAHRVACVRVRDGV